MSVVIKDMEMPKTCYECPFGLASFITLWNGTKRDSRTYSCVITKKTMTSTKRNRFCPLKEQEGE